MASITEPAVAVFPTEPAGAQALPGCIMSYSDFTIDDIKERFNLTLDEDAEYYINEVGRVVAIIAAMLRGSVD